ncbi:MAG: hypothetical protein ABIJ16_06175, partial [Bacteroidota bacterium]
RPGLEKLVLNNATPPGFCFTNCIEYNNSFIPSGLSCKPAGNAIINDEKVECTNTAIYGKHVRSGKS